MQNGDEINLRDYLEVVRRRWLAIVLLTAALALLAFVASSLKKPVYEASATFLIKTAGPSGNLSQLSGLASLAGLNLPSGGGSNLNDLTALLQSKAVALKVMTDLKLRERVAAWSNPALSDDQVAGLVRGLLKKPRTDGNLIELRTAYTDPQLAAEVTNGYLDALSYYWNRLNYTEARKKREYIEGQLPRVKGELNSAEQALKQYTLLSPADNGSSADNQLRNIVPGAQTGGVEVNRLSRELDIQASVYSMLRKEYEQVKLEESKEIEPFTVIDLAQKPLKPSQPRPRVDALIGGLAGLVLGVVGAFFKEYWDKTD